MTTKSGTTSVVLLVSKHTLKTTLDNKKLDYKWTTKCKKNELYLKMGSRHNRLRKKWQDLSGTKALQAEYDFYNLFDEFFKESDYMIIDKPKDFTNLYVDVKLSQKTLKEIYNPEKPITKHGVKPDYAIKNTLTNKTIYVEVKRQDGWVENLPRSAGRGNAHERSNKFFTPGLIKSLRKKGNIEPPHLPFWTVFQGNITRDPCRVREVTLWYGEYIANYFFWRKSNTGEIIKHFNDHIVKIID
tara:strand:- start:891 stop:1619 length:729 start_codon:yes stop_codon:yes gene_type:complete